MRVHLEDREVAIKARGQQILLAMLLLHADRAVPAGSLVEALWPLQPPQNVRNQLQQTVLRLRRWLGDIGLDRHLIVTEPGGYRLAVDPKHIDLHEFRALVNQARIATGEQRLDQASTAYRAAIALWRGPALAGLDTAAVRDAAAALDGERVQAIEGRIEVELALGNTGEVIAELDQLTRQYPYREKLHGAYMLALYRAGRCADALTAYRHVDQLLRDELGVDPGQELQELHKAILERDPSLDPVPVPPAQPARAAPLSTPRELPADVAGFTGRAAELAELVSAAEGATVVIGAIDGMAGIGKTALAVHAAHRLADRYPDGQIFIDLHGYTEGVAPIDPGGALDRMLRALGIQQIPAGIDERAALYRTRVADRRVLIVLDNAATEAQVTPLLPGAAGCLVLLTSRRRLTGLDSTRTLSLDTLSVADAATLLVRAVGRLDREPFALLAELVDLCGRLPLAIRIASARLSSHPTWNPAHLVERLRDHRSRLGELAAGQRSITATLDLSYHDLDPAQRRVYRLLGLHPGPDIDAYATAALLDSTLLHARRTLDQLLDAHLLREPAPDRYRCHDLVRAHAAYTATIEPDHAAGDAALDRLLDYYRSTASHAMDVAYPYERERRPPVPPARTPRPDLPNAATALGWLDTELSNLLIAAGYAAERGRPEHILHLSTILHRHLRSRGRYHDAETLHSQAHATASAIGHQAGEQDALICLGHLHQLQGRHREATDQFRQALRLARATGHYRAELEALAGLGRVHWAQGRHEQAGELLGQVVKLARRSDDRTGALEALTGLGWVHWLQGRYADSADHLTQALQLARATGHAPAELDALLGLGHVNRRRGSYEEAADQFENALQLARNTGDLVHEISAMSGLGHIHQRGGRYELAADHFRRVLQVARSIGHRAGELVALSGLGCVDSRLGQHARAADQFQQLLALARDAGDRNFEFEAWYGLGRLQHAAGHPDAATGHYHEALALAAELGQPDDSARAHDGLAHAYRALNRHHEAREHWQHALDILTKLGVDHTNDEETTRTAIHRHLAGIDQNSTR